MIGAALAWLAGSWIGKALAAVAGSAAIWAAGILQGRAQARRKAAEAESRAKDEALEVRDEVGNLDGAGVRDRLDKWMRDR